MNARHEGRHPHSPDHPPQKGKDHRPWPSPWPRPRHAARPAGVEQFESRRLLAGTVDLADQLAFGFPVGPASVVGMGTDAQGNVYLGGRFEGTVDFNPARRKTFNLTATAADTGDAFVAKYSPAGGLFWAVHLAHANAMQDHPDVVVFDLATDRTGNTYLAGHFERTVDFDPGPGTVNLTADPNASGEPFLLSLDPSGNVRYAIRHGGPWTVADAFEGSGMRVATDPAGHVYLAATFEDHPDTGPRHSDTTVTKFTATGRALWTRHYGGTDAGVSPFALTVDADGNAFLAGPVSGRLRPRPRRPLGPGRLGVRAEARPAGRLRVARRRRGRHGLRPDDRPRRQPLRDRRLHGNGRLQLQPPQAPHAHVGG